jgi:hypothetical protein
MPTSTPSFLPLSSVTIQPRPASLESVASLMMRPEIACRGHAERS